MEKKEHDSGADAAEVDEACPLVPASTASHAAPKHTPGPWVVGRDGQKWNSPSSPFVAIEWHRPCPFGGEPTLYHLAEVSYPTNMAGTVGELERRANAHLIAAAPELLEALKAAHLWIVLQRAMMTEHTHPQALRNIDADIERVKQALAKAEPRP